LRKGAVYASGSADYIACLLAGKIDIVSTGTSGNSIGYVIMSQVDLSY